MGVPPVRIEVLNSISGVDFQSCRQRRAEAILDGVLVSFIGLHDLLTNKKAAGRDKDLNDLNHLNQPKHP